MDKNEIRRTLEKQLELLSKRSENCGDPSDLAMLSEMLLKIAEALIAGAA